MSKFKVGDKVRVKKYKERPYYWNDKGKMDHLMGKIVTINSIMSRYLLCVFDEKYNRDWFFKERDFEPVNETIVIYRKDQSVIALDKTAGKTAEARCNPADTFDFMTGAKLAFERLTSTRELLNTKIRITNVPFTPIACRLTVGKIYEVKDGKFTNDQGDIFPLYSSLHNIEELRMYLTNDGQPGIKHYTSVSINFVEVVE